MLKLKKNNTSNRNKKAERGTGEVARQLGICTALAEDPEFSSQHPHQLAHTTCKSSSTCPMTCSGLYRNLHSSSRAHVHIYHTHNLKWKNKKRIRTQINTLKCTSIVWKEEKKNQKNRWKEVIKTGAEINETGKV